MINTLSCPIRLKTIMVGALAAVSASCLVITRAEAVSLKIDLEVLGTLGNGELTPLWFGIHDGSFNTFDPGATASTGLELLAEEGITGLEDPTFLDDVGVDPNQSISALFANTTNGVQGDLAYTPIIGTLPGQTVSATIEVDPQQNRYFSYAAMFFPSNDAFIGDANALELFDAAGNFLGADIVVAGTDIYDAGTEVNDESLESVPFSPDIFGQGITENGVIQRHPGLQPVGSGGVLDNPIVDFSTADFLAPGFQVARIRVSQVPEPATVLASLSTFGIGLLLKRRRRGLLKPLRSSAAMVGLML